MRQHGNNTHGNNAHGNNINPKKPDSQPDPDGQPTRNQPRGTERTQAQAAREGRGRRPPKGGGNDPERNTPQGEEEKNKKERFNKSSGKEI